MLNSKKLFLLFFKPKKEKEISEISTELPTIPDKGYIMYHRAQL